MAEGKHFQIGTRFLHSYPRDRPRILVLRVHWFLLRRRLKTVQVLPDIDSLCSVMVTINNGFDSACKSGPSRQVEYCRLGMEGILEQTWNFILVIAYSKGKMVATPHMKDQMILIMKRDFYKTGQMASFFKKMRIRKGFQLMYTRWRSLKKLRSVRQFETP